MKHLLLTILSIALLPLAAFAGGNKSQVPLADPYILLDGGKYYAYGTHDGAGIRCYSSDDLRLWKDEGRALDKSNTTETQWFWAPEVYRVGDKYIMYYSANEHLFAATATSPKGPFRQVGGYQMQDLLGDEKCIDSHIFFDDDGTAYIFFVRFNDGNCIWQARLGSDYITPDKSTLRKCFAVSQDWEKKMGRVNEGPNVIKYNRRYYLTYSGNDYRSQDYAVGFATTSNIATGTWTKYASNPVLRRWDDLVGTGHHSLFYDKEGILRIVFHAHESPERVGSRCMYIGTMTFRSGNLVMLDDPVIRPTLSTTAPYSPELITQTPGFERGGAVTIDLNNDGALDIVTAGSGNEVQNAAQDEFTSKRMSYLATFSPTTHRWTRITTAPPFRVADSPSLIPCDINNDGYMDIIAFEQVGTDVTAEAYTGNYGREGIFLGKGSGRFEEAQLTLLHADGSACTDFDMRAPCNAEIIDVDNDGRLDVILAGHQAERSYNVILHNLTEGNGALTFAVEPYEQEFLLREAIIQPADFNNDGWTDFIVSAQAVGRAEQVRFTDLYLNEGGHFRRLGLGDNGAYVKRKSNGALVVADLNNDGWMDFMLSGQGEASSGETTARQRVFLNKKEALPAFSIRSGDLQTDIYTLASAAGNAAGLIDWDGDGDFDIMLGGTKSNVCSGMLYLNDGRGGMKRSTAIPGATGASIIYPDYNGDGRKDFWLNGFCTDRSYLPDASQHGRSTILCYNLGTVTTAPDAPVAATVHQQGAEVTLAWQAPESAKPCFTYDIWIKDEAGRLVNCTPAIIGGTKDGMRKADRLGRVGCRTEWTFRPATPGTYTWGVQTIDATYTGSAFTEGPAFTVTAQDIEDGLTRIPSAAEAPTRLYTLTGQRTSQRTTGITIEQNSQGTRKTLFAR